MVMMTTFAQHLKATYEMGVPSERTSGASAASMVWRALVQWPRPPAAAPC
jgi:hypothetical protein